MILILFNKKKRKKIFIYTSCKENAEMQISLNGYVAPDVVCSVSNSDSVLLSECIHDVPVLVFRHSNLNCKSCVEHSYSYLEKYFKEEYLSSILILYSADFDVNISSYKRAHRIPFTSYRIQENSFDWIPETRGNPYFFVLYPDMSTSYFFMADKKYPEMTKAYLEGIRRIITDDSDKKKSS